MVSNVTNDNILISSFDTESIANNASAANNTASFAASLASAQQSEVAQAENTTADTTMENLSNLLMMSMLMNSMGSMGGSSNSMGSMMSTMSTMLMMQVMQNSGMMQNATDAYTQTAASSSNVAQAASVNNYNSKSSESGQQVVDAAKSRLGDPYSQPKSGQGDYVDCSSLTQWAHQQVGVNLPRTAAEQARYCVDNNLTVSKDELQPGDLIFFSLKENGRYMNVSHVGIYAGDGMMVDASSSRGEVVYREVFDGQVLYARAT